MSHSTIRLGQKMNFTIKDDKYEHIGLTPMVLNVDLEQNPNKTGGLRRKTKKIRINKPVAKQNK